jgi:hypothetical protein
LARGGAQGNAAKELAVGQIRGVVGDACLLETLNEAPAPALRGRALLSAPSCGVPLGTKPAGNHARLRPVRRQVLDFMRKRGILDEPHPSTPPPGFS